MAGENESEVEEQEVEQTQQSDDSNPLASTGSKDWDKIIDDSAGIGEKQDEQKASNTTGKSADGTQQAPIKQVDPAAVKQQQPTDNTTQQRQSAPQDQVTQQTRAPARKFGNLFQAGPDGNIYDTNGGLIAKQGLARSTFHRIWPTIEILARERAGLQQTVQNYESANELAKREGLSLDEHGAALQMFAQYKKDPVKTLNTLLTLAEQAGRDVSTIRQATGPSVTDIASRLEEIVDSRLKPFSFLTEQRRVDQEQQAIREEVQNEYAEFVEEFPDSIPHTDALARVMHDKRISAREAYYAVRAFAATNGLDWNKPLAEQLVAKDQQRNPSGDGQNRRQLPRMGGRNTREDTHVENGALDQNNANDSWDAIAKKAMAKHGIQL